MPSMQEFKVLIPPLNKDDLEKELNDLGKVRWKIACSVTPGGPLSGSAFEYIILQREKH